MVILRVLSTLWKMLNFRRRVKFALIVVMLFVAGVFELTGMLAMFGFIQGLSVNEATGHRSGKVAYGLEYMLERPLEATEYALWGGAVLVGVMLFKNLLGATVHFYFNRFLMKLNHKISRDLFEGYMRAPYERLNARHYGSPVENVGRTFAVFSACFGGTAQVLADGTMVLVVVALLMSVDLWLTLGSAAAFLGVGTLLYRLMELVLVRMGRQEVSARRAAQRYLHEGLHGIIETRLRDAPRFFVTRYARALSHRTLVTRRKKAIERLPRTSNEVLLALIVAGAVLYMTMSGSDVHAALPTLALFGFAGLRLSGAMSRINASLQSLRQNAEQFESAYQAALEVAPQAFRGTELNTDNDYLADEEPLPAGVNGRLNHKLELKNVSFAYAEGSAQALRDVSVTIERGKLTSFCGPSGGGKSTLLMILMGLMRPQSGSVECDGRSVFKFIRSWHKNIGYVGQRLFIAPASVRENVAFGVPPEEIDDDKVWRALELAAAAKFVRKLPERLETSLEAGGRRLSGGQRQRIVIARALYEDPDIIVFDEATAALDNITEREITEAVMRLSGQKTVICVAHRLTTIRDSHVIHLVDDGTILASGTYDELLATSPMFAKMALEKPRKVAPAKQASQG